VHAVHDKRPYILDGGIHDNHGIVDFKHGTRRVRVLDPRGNFPVRELATLVIRHRVTEPNGLENDVRVVKFIIRLVRFAKLGVLTRGSRVNGGMDDGCWRPRFKRVFHEPRGCIFGLGNVEVVPGYVKLTLRTFNNGTRNVHV